MSGTLHEARIEGIGHENFIVRSAALGAIAGEREPGAAAAMRAIRQIEKHGWRDAFEFPSQIRNLPHTAESVKWVADWLVEFAPTTGQEEPQHHFNEWFCKAPVEWLLPQIDRFVETLKAELPPLTGSIRSNPVVFSNPKISFAHAVDRLEAAMWSGEKLRGKLETMLERCAAAPEFPHAEVRTMEVICEALAARGECREEARGAWLDIADPDSEREIGVPDYRAGAALMILRYGKIRPPVERIVRLFQLDWDWLNELVEDAIVAGGNRDTLRDLLRLFPEQLWHAKLYLSSAFVRLRFDGFEENLIELLRNEEADEIRARLARALALYGSAKAVAVAEEFVAEYPEDPERGSIVDVLRVDEILTGRDTLETRRHIQEMMRFYQQ
ncbi:MAG: hypothetical protein KDN05_18680, partial [Verrucomicrobiae bacterium]|nr:hypothetical protein [Verrucomicrobiae bacterium]